MISKNKKVTVGNDGRGIVLMIEVAGGNIAFMKRRAIDVNLPVADADRLVGQADHPFDVRLRRIERIPENHNVAALDRLQPIDKFVDEDALVVHEARHHAGALDLNRLIEKNDDDESEKRGKNQVSQPVARVKKTKRALAGDGPRAGACCRRLLDVLHTPKQLFYITFAEGRLRARQQSQSLLECKHSMPRNYALIIPAFNEEASVTAVLKAVPLGLFTDIVVVDNGSTDGTAAAARTAGARVIQELRRGYGQACQAGLRSLKGDIEAVAFMDADFSDDPADLAALVPEFEAGGYDLVIGSRVLGEAEKGSLTPLQRFGNGLATWLIRRSWGVRFTDLGPMRIIRRDALNELQLTDPNFGWTVEMQGKAAQRGLKVAEIPVRYRRRLAGTSKISGTLAGSCRAGWKILWTIYACWRSGTRHPKRFSPQSSQRSERTAGEEPLREQSRSRDP